MSDGRARKPRNTSSGSATNPVSRSRTTDANATDEEFTVFDARDTRSTSPPIVDGSTLPTNSPAR